MLGAVAIPSEGPLTRLNAACPYFTMFPLSFPLEALASAGPGSRVLDPFCGRGTTVYAARLLGLEVTGIDVNPVAVAIAEAKLASAKPETLVRLARRLIAEQRHAVVPPESEFWSLAFEETTLRDIAALRAGLLVAPKTDAVRLLRAIALGALHGPRGKVARSYFSNQMPRTYATKPASAVRFWRARDLAPEAIDIVNVIGVRAQRFLRDLPSRGHGRVLLGDARKLLRPTRNRYTHIVCSPPYLGMRTYLPDQWLRWWFLGGPADVAYRLPGQIATADADRFVGDLAATWDAVAKVSVPRAELTVRFGALPSVNVEPSDIVSASLERARARWLLMEERPAGQPRKGRRQAEQFRNATGDATHEVDVVARLA